MTVKNPATSASSGIQALETGLHDQVVFPMKVAIEGFEWIATLHGCITDSLDHAESKRDEASMEVAIYRIRVLTEIAKYLGDVFSGDLQCAHERLEHNPIRAIRQMMEGKSIHLVAKEG